MCWILKAYVVQWIQATLTLVFSLHWATKSTVSKNLRMAIGCTARLSLAVVEPLIEHAPLHDNRSVIS